MDPSREAVVRPPVGGPGACGRSGDGQPAVRHVWGAMAHGHQRAGPARVVDHGPDVRLRPATVTWRSGRIGKPPGIQPDTLIPDTSHFSSSRMNRPPA